MPPALSTNIGNNSENDAYDDDGTETNPLTLGNNNHHDNDNTTTDHNDTVSLQDRILQIIGTCPNRTIRPAQLTAQLGTLSVEDATAELCGLLAAVGGGEQGATFQFETITTAAGNDKNQDNQNANRTQLHQQQQHKQHVMVFTFPPDYVQRAQRAKRRQDWKESLQATATLVWKILQIITALGLILSLLILTVAAILAMVAALIALQREGRSNNHRHLTRQIQHLCLTVREMLWCYAVFGPDIHNNAEDEHNGNRDPFLRELAYDMALWSSVCCGHPGSIFYWYRVRQLSNRRHRMARGWRRHTAYQDIRDSDNVEGVQLIRQRPSQQRSQQHSPGRWSSYDDSNSNSNSSTNPNNNGHRGILSVAVEFLFGPQQQAQEVERHNQEKWKLRAAFLVQQSSGNNSNNTNNHHHGGGVSLQEMSPYTDDPPVSLEDTSRVVTEGLLIVSHFQGMPLATAAAGTVTNDDNTAGNSMATARFGFPQLVSESSVALQYNNTKTPDDEDMMDGNWSSVLFRPNDATVHSSPNNNNNNHSQDTTLPTHYRETLLRLTHLTPTQFSSCAALGLLNLIGVVWFRQATSLGGVMNEVAEFQALARVLRRTLVPILVFYALLFWCLPLSRLTYVVWTNRSRQKRNARRQYLAKVVAAN